jgi:hypothetical protein
MRNVREMLKEGERFPSRRTFERRLKALPEKLPKQIGCLGRHLVALLRPWERLGRAVALDSTVLRARGEWHKKDCLADKVPHTSIDTEAGWTKPGWHGWVYRWKLHLAVTVGAVWIPLSARLTPANAADNKVAPSLIEALPEETRFVLGDSHCNAQNVHEACVRGESFLVASGREPYPHTDAGVEVRRIFHILRHRTIESFNEHFKAFFDVHGPVPTKGQTNTARFALQHVAMRLDHTRCGRMNTSLEDPHRKIGDAAKRDIPKSEANWPNVIATRYRSGVGLSTRSALPL